MKGFDDYIRDSQIPDNTVIRPLANWKLRSKAGPNGKATLSCMTDLLVLLHDPKLLSWISKLGKITWQPGLYKSFEQYKGGLFKD